MGNLKIETKSIYGLTYGYSNHQLTFVSTREYLRKCEDVSVDLKISENEYAEADFNKIYLITEDADFIEKFQKLNMSNFNPLDYCRFEDEDD